jgi:hypothetical protein
MSTSKDSLNPSDVFATRTRADAEFRREISPGNPAMYISNVDYGRMMLLGVSYNHSVNEVQAAVQAAVSYGLSGGKGGLDTTSKQILEDSYVHAYILGGSSTDAANIAAASLGGKASDTLINAVTGWLIYGAVFSPDTSPAAPISYAVRYLGDGSPFVALSTANWQQKACNLKSISIDRIRVRFKTYKDNSWPLGFRCLIHLGKRLPNNTKVRAKIGRRDPTMSKNQAPK